MKTNPLDTPETTIQRKSVILSKKYLHKTYEHFYKKMLRESKNLPPGMKVELGSGAGFIKNIIPGVLTSDIMKLPFCDITFPAEKIPFPASSVSAYYMLNTLHHIKNPKRAFREFVRTLRPGGKIIMIEPANTRLSKIVYRHFHHEHFDEKAVWLTKTKGSLSSSNQALAYILFMRDVNKFHRLYPELRLIKYENHTPFSYIVSGGFTLPQFLPGLFFPFVAKLENIMAFANNYIGMFTTVVIKKVSTPKNRGTRR